MKYLIGMVVAFFTVSALAQDAHQSQFMVNKILLNPAYTGLIKTDIRGGINYRSQWASMDGGFRSFSAAVDLPIIDGAGRNDQFGGALILEADKAGQVFSDTYAALAFSYVKSLHKDGTQFLSIGLELGVNQRSIDYSSIIEWVGTNSNQENVVYPDLSMGLLWYNMPNDRTQLSLGVSLYHLKKNNISTLESTSLLDKRINVHGQLQYKLENGMALHPSLMIQFQGPHQEIILGTFVKLTKRASIKKPSFYIGSFYRFNDAWINAIRIDYQSIILTFSYDMATSSISALQNVNGGLEFSMVYNGFLSKNSKSNPKKSSVKCPKI